MSQPYIGEIRMFGGNFPPNGWAFCDGQQLAIAENDALFTLIGTTYGGDGQSFFNLPDLQSRVPVHQGTGPGGQTFVEGEAGGVESVTLTTAQLPAHTHPMLGSVNNATSSSPTDNVPASTPLALNQTAYGTDVPIKAIAPTSIAPFGGSQPHENTQPFLVISFILSLFGIFPTQN